MGSFLEAFACHINTLTIVCKKERKPSLRINSLQIGTAHRVSSHPNSPEMEAINQ
jgi:hypothetical protein